MSMRDNVPRDQVAHEKITFTKAPMPSPASPDFASAVIDPATMPPIVDARADDGGERVIIIGPDAVMPAPEDAIKALAALSPEQLAAAAAAQNSKPAPTDPVLALLSEYGARIAALEHAHAQMREQMARAISGARNLRRINAHDHDQGNGRSGGSLDVGGSRDGTGVG